MDRESSKEFLMNNKDALPEHVAIIMDGNGRWAVERGFSRPEGHKAGAQRVRPVLELCRELDIPVLTLFAFSTENWQRPKPEVDAIMGLLVKYIEEETETLIKNRVRLRFLGSHERISADIRKKMETATETTSKDYKYTLNICINYGGRDEILRAVGKLLKKTRDTEGSVHEVSEEEFSDCLYTSGLPDPDILIRTGGDRRISNFLLWQAAYAEIIFYPKFWPDFYPEDLMICLEDFMGRERRFGRIEED